MGQDLKMLQGQDRLQYLVDKAREVEPLPEVVKTEENRIHGCASKLWLIGGVALITPSDGTLQPHKYKTENERRKGQAQGGKVKGESW